MSEKNPIGDCLDFFEKAVPGPGAKNIHTQLGVHLEEVREMLLELHTMDDETKDMVFVTGAALHGLANHLKANDCIVRIKDENRVGYLDAICDQIVTAIGCAHMIGLDVVGGFNEVNRSNLSKFGRDGMPIFDEDKKIQKGPDYSPADLIPFV